MHYKDNIDTVPGIFQGILGNDIFCLFWNFSLTRVILGKLLYVLIALVLFFIIHNYLKDIYSMSHFYLDNWESCIPAIFFIHPTPFETLHECNNSYLCNRQQKKDVFANLLNGSTIYSQGIKIQHKCILTLSVKNRRR